MKKMFEKPRGTRDFDSEEMQKRHYVENSMRKVFKSFGYNEIQTPTFETLELFTAKSGEEIIEEIYSFEDKGERKLALRPELTAPVIRFYVEKMQMKPKPLKLFYIGNCYRYDRPQKGRFREFTQAGCELIGVDTPEANAELITMAYKILEKTGLKDIELYIGNLTVLSAIFESFNIKKEQQKYLTPLIDKEEWDELTNALYDYDLTDEKINKILEILKNPNIQEIEKIVQQNPDAKKQLLNLKKTMKLLKEVFLIKNSKLKMSIVRGLDYYTGIVFEIEAPSLGAEKQLCGGGAYELIPLFQGRPTATAGFAIGFDRTIVALDAQKQKFPDTILDLFIISVNDETIIKSIKIAQKIREQDFKVDIDLKRRNIGKALKYAASKNAKKAIIVGPDELKEDSITLRDMKTGEQKKVKIDEILKNTKNYF